MILGIDLGTSSIKAMLLNPETGASITAAREYDVIIPQPGHAEQDPELWWSLLKEALLELRERDAAGYARITAIGFSGQMHGLVMLDGNGKPVRNAIIWLDQRSKEQVEQIYTRVTPEEMLKRTHNRPAAGFAFPSLLWVMQHEREIYDRCACIMHPKDYLRFKLTGVMGTDMSDASASAAFHVKERRWDAEILSRLGVDLKKLPVCHEATDIAGTLTPRAAAETGLPANVQVVYGCGDQPAQSIGNGAVSEGTIIANIGTGGQIACFSASDKCDPQMRIHTFCHGIERGYTIFGASLCSGLSLRWLKNNVLSSGGYDEMTRLAEEAEPGSGGLIYLPYLTGERTPHMDPNAKGMFFGLRLDHDRRHFIRAVMEGVTLSLRDSIEIFAELGIPVKRIIASGGGARSRLWLQMQADIFGCEVIVSRVQEQACLGACIVAGIGTGIFASAEEAAGKLVRFHPEIYRPIPENVRRYNEIHALFQQLYRRNQDLFRSIDA